MSDKKEITVKGHPRGELWIIEYKDAWVPLEEVGKYVEMMFKGVELDDASREFLKSFVEGCKESKAKIHLPSFTFGTIYSIVETILNLSSMIIRAIDDGHPEVAYVLYQLKISMVSMLNTSVKHILSRMRKSGEK